MARECINIANWNACSLKSKAIEFADFLNERTIDVAIITETHLKPGVNIYLPDFRVVRLDRTHSAGGGVAIALRKNICCKLLPSFNLKVIEAVGVEVSTPVGPIIIIAAYCPSQVSSRNDSSSNLKQDLVKLTRHRQNFILAGDLNAKHQAWGNTRSNPNGKVVHNDLQASSYIILSPDSPTRLSRSGVHSTIDFFITNMANLSNPIVYQELSSDHFPVVAEVGYSANRFRARRRNYHRADWPRFQQFIDANIRYNIELESTDDIDQCLQIIDEALSLARDQHIPASDLVSNTLNLDSLTKSYIRLRNTTRRHFQRTGLPHLKSYCNRLNKIIKARLVDLRNKSFESHLRSLPDCANPFWKLTKLLKNKPRPVPPLSHSDQQAGQVQLITPAEKANALGQHFVNSHNLGRSLVSPFEPDVAATMSRIAVTPLVVPEESIISADEVMAAIKSCKNMKAAGVDGVVNLELKNLSVDFFHHLAKIFNKCLELGYFPSRWKLAKVIPIHKPGKDPTDAKSYRPISLLSSISKLFEKLILRRILEFADQNNIFLREQFGFRKGHSTVHQLTRVTNIIRRNKSVSKTTAMALLDVEKAFDNVWHDGLVYKLHRCNFPIFLVKIIKNYLSGRSFRVCLNNSQSDTFNVDAGVPQGSLLGPILFNIFTSDVPPLPDGGVLSMFADDTAIMYKGRVIRSLTRKLQAGLDVLSGFFNNWKICINAAKTQAILFPHSNSRRLVPPDDVRLKINNSPIEWSREVGYLGLVLDSKLIFRSHVEKTSIKGNILIKSLYPLINRKSKLSLKNKLAVHKMIILPVLEYGLPIWESCAKYHHDKLQVIQNKILRMILNSPPRTRNSEIHQLAGLDTLLVRKQAILSRFRDACQRSIHEEIRSLSI